MSISISKSLNLFFSQRMNKTNVMLYLAIYALMMLPYMMYSYTKNQQYMLPAYLFYFFGLFILPGVQVITTNNIVKNKENVVPGFNEIPQILLNGLKITVWSLVIAFFIMIPAFVLFFAGGFFGALSNKMLPAMIICTLILVVFAVIFTLRYTIPAYCYFSKNLKFISFFHLPKIFEFMRKRNFCYGSYLLKLIGISLLYFFIIAFLFLIVFFVVFISNGIQGEFVPDKLLLPLYFLYIIACGLFGFAIYIPMTAQFVNSVEDDETEINDFDSDNDTEDDFI